MNRTLLLASFVAVFVSIFGGSPTLRADDKTAESTPRETIAKPMSDKERKRQEARYRKELETPFRKWLSEDVPYIITEEERTAFKRMKTDEERENFIEEFWRRRDPTPDSEENEYKEEHYRRIAYANERFASGIPGWKTDRGRIYITFGPPDEIESHPSGGSYQRPTEEGGGQTSTYPFEQWRFRYIEGVGTNVIIEFVDTTLTGEYHMTMDPSEKDALTNVPGAGLTQNEQIGLSSKTDRFSRTDGTRLGTGTTPLPARLNQFERLQQFTNLQRAPKIKFRDLETVVTSSIKYNTLPMQARADYIRTTNSSVLTSVTLQFNRKDLQFAQKNGTSKATVNILGRITSLTGRIVNTFEDTVAVEVPDALLQKAIEGQSVYQKSIPLAPGLYRLNVVAKDVTGGNVTNFPMKLEVPRYDDERLGSSSLILADLIEKVPTNSIGTGQFVIGASKVRPRFGEQFRRDEKMGIYLQVYNFGPDEKTNRPNGTIEYEIVNTGTNEKVLEFKEEVSKASGTSASMVTVEKLLPLQSMKPGQYTLRMKVVDLNRNQTLTPSATFTIT